VQPRPPKSKTGLGPPFLAFPMSLVPLRSHDREGDPDAREGRLTLDIRREHSVIESTVFRTDMSSARQRLRQDDGTDPSRAQQLMLGRNSRA
jgi:hypothetical protein